MTTPRRTVIQRLEKIENMLTEIRTELKFVLPDNKRRISRLENGFIGIASVIIIAVVGKLIGAI